MNSQLALRIALPVPLRQFFDYLPPTDCNVSQLQPGIRVRVPFLKKELVGILIETTHQPDLPWEKLRSACEIIDKTPIVMTDIWQICFWAAEYYHYPIGEVLSHALPVLLRRGKPAIIKKKPSWQLPDSGISSTEFEINDAQRTAITAIQQAIEQFKVFLLDGVTGSGKTEVYLQAITSFLNKNKQILILVPEIGLTPQTIQRFQERFNNILILALHSNLSEKERLHVWLAAQLNQAKIIIGTRSALFTPFANLGLVIIDEEHDLSFKQQDNFRYHARDLAIMRAHFNKIPIILGSATPSLESLHNARSQRYQHLCLPERAGIAKLPDVCILDIRKQPLEQGLSAPLLAEIKTHLNQGSQVLLFLNRRGFAPILMCHACGWMAKCKRCDIHMTYHHHNNRLHCHHCESQQRKFARCDVCSGQELHLIGLGTERLEDALAKHFPQFSIARIDRDTTQRKGSMEKLLTQIQEGEHRILIGTQMLAKGHHFPNVTLVAIVDADGGFFSSDFRGLERMGQLLTQVTGRAGRAEKPGKVIIQTHHPDHPLLHQLLYKNYDEFAMSLLAERNQAQLPPYFFFALFRAEAYDPQHAITFLQHIKNIKVDLDNKVRMLGPIAAPMPRRAGRHRVQLLIQASQRTLLQNCLKQMLPKIDKIPSKHKVRWSLDVDPSEMY